MPRPLIRLLPNPDGTFMATQWFATRDEFDVITPQAALHKLAQGANVQVAVNDEKCKHTHWENDPAPMKRI